MLFLGSLVSLISRRSAFGLDRLVDFSEKLSPVGCDSANGEGSFFS